MRKFQFYLWLSALCRSYQGCASEPGPTSVPQPAITSVVPSATGTPNSIATFGNFEFISVQGTGQIFTYNIATGSQIPVGSPYETPASTPAAWSSPPAPATPSWL